MANHAMKPDDIRNLVAITFTSELAGISLTDDLELLESGIIDSLALNTLVARLEEAIPGLRIPDSDVTPEALGSVDRIAAYLSRRGFP
jgi:acyl carrier protein